MAAPYSRDSRETAEQVASAGALLARLRTRFDAVADNVFPAMVPEPRSPLERIDQLSQDFKVSEVIQFQLGAAVDNVRSVFRYLEEVGELPMVALNSMIRSAVEATSYGLWILKGNGNQQKVSKALRLTRQDHESLATMMRALGGPTAGVEAAVVALRAEHERLTGVTSADFEQEVQATNTVMAADAVVGRRPGLFTGLQVWRATSGLAHASAPAMVALLERDADGMRTPRLTFLAAFLQVAIENLEGLHGRYTSLAASPPPRA